MERSPHHKLLTRYLNGECTQEEAKLVEDWFASFDQRSDDDRLFDPRQEVELREQMLAAIRTRINVNKKPVVRSLRWPAISLRIAATLLVAVLAAGTWWFSQKRETGGPLKTSQADVNQVVTLHNTTSVVTMYSLPDGSTIHLQPGGIITYAGEFAQNKREVQLVGEAFFDVTKDAMRPFIIDAQNVLVKVLGTSFSIKAYENDPEVKVAVRTGTVSVTRPVKAASKAGPEEVILTPNQEVVYNTVRENFSKQIVATPQIILQKPTLMHMKYESTPVDEIFKVLQENYGIEIVYDPVVLSSCTLTTTLEEEGFYERIEIICQAIGATFEIQDAKVVIKSAGCQESNN